MVYDFFIDETCDAGKFYYWKMTRRWVSSIIHIAFNDESFEKMSQKSRIRMYKYGEKYLVPLNPLGNIKITKYFNYKYRLNGVFSRDILPKIFTWK